jgi:hypothetical protein
VSATPVLTRSRDFNNNIECIYLVRVGEGCDEMLDLTCRNSSELVVGGLNWK